MTFWRFFKPAPSPKRRDEWHAEKQKRQFPTPKQKEAPMLLPKAKRPIEKAVYHCTATTPYMDLDVKTIRKWHVQGRGWSDIGYHFLIKRDGTLEHGRHIEKVGAHAAGHNARSIGIALVGGLDDNKRPAANFTNPQWATLKKVTECLREQYPGIVIQGHNELGPKACPSFDVQVWLRDYTVKPVG